MKPAAATSFNLYDLFASVAGAVGDREAAVQGGRRLSYRELDDRSRRLATALAARGVGPGDHIGLQLQNSTEYLEGMLAAFLLRAVPVNVNYRYVADELRYLYADADLVALVHEPAFASNVDLARAGISGLRATLMRGESYEASLAAVEPLDPASVPGRSGEDRYI
ncbi:MAG: AMP-binding protein, partial [Actinomycetota bacterium]|nr:AMP-binding protein [Actinomycetota bacterium]